MATRADAIENAREQLRSGAFINELNRRVGYKTESQNAGSGAALRAYLEEDLQPAFAALDFTTRLIDSPTGRGPYLLADGCPPVGENNLNKKSSSCSFYEL